VSGAVGKVWGIICTLSIVGQGGGTSISVSIDTIETNIIRSHSVTIGDFCGAGCCIGIENEFGFAQQTVSIVYTGIQTVGFISWQTPIGGLVSSSVGVSILAQRTHSQVVIEEGLEIRVVGCESGIIEFSAGHGGDIEVKTVSNLVQQIRAGSIDRPILSGCTTFVRSIPF